MPTADHQLMASQPSSGNLATQYFVWQCLKCGYALVSKDPPERCPDCGATRQDFVPLEED
jgi:rubrerythrin